MRHLKRSYETIDFSEFLPEVLTEEEVKAVLELELPSTVNDVPTSSQMASTYETPTVQGNVNSTPSPGEGIVYDLITSSQTLPSIDELFDLASQIASTPGDASSSYDSSSSIHISTPSTPAPPGDTNLHFDTTSSNPFPVLHISAPPSLTAPGDTIISSPEHDSVLSTPSVLGDAQIGYQTTSSQPFLTLCNTVNSVPSTAQAQCFNQLSCGLPSTGVASRAPERADINHQISLQQPSLAPNNVAPPAPGCTSINSQMSFNQLSPDYYNLAQSAPGCANFNYQMSFSQPSPVRYIIVPSAPRSADVNQLKSYRPLIPALHNASPRCDTSSHQMNACHPRPALKKSILSAREKTSARKRQRVRISKPALVILNKWFDSHIEQPYPDKRAVEMLSSTCNITATQVKKWCSNKRKKGRKQPKAQIPTPPATSDSKDNVNEHAV